MCYPCYLVSISYFIAYDGETEVLYSCRLIIRSLSDGGSCSCLSKGTGTQPLTCDEAATDNIISGSTLRLRERCFKAIETDGVSRRCIQSAIHN